VKNKCVHHKNTFIDLRLKPRLHVELGAMSWVNRPPNTHTHTHTHTHARADVRTQKNTEYFVF